MHDLGYFRANFDTLAQRLATRSNPPNLDRFRELDKRRRAAITETEQLQARANEASSQIGKLKREGADTSEAQEQVRVLKVEIAALEQQKKAAEAEFEQLLIGVPNVPHESVPVG